MKKFKILLMAVYCDGMLKTYEELGICYIASYMRQRGYEVVLKCVEEKNLDYQKLQHIEPDIIGISVYDINKECVYNVSKKLKQFLPNSIITVGGNLPSYYGKEILEECEFIDFVMRGEGEETFLEVVQKLEQARSLSNVKGITYRNNGIITKNENRPIIKDLDTIPNPARDMLIQNNSIIAQISTSRGCTAKCSFCASQLFWKKWRGRNVMSILDEVEYIVNTFGITAFNFIDGSFEDPGGSSTRIEEIAKGLVDRRLNIDYFAHIRAEFHKKATPQLMTLLKKSGLCGVCIGIESGNDDDLRLYKKNAGVEDMEKAIDLFREYDINIESAFINFNPYSTFDGLRKNIEFLYKYGLACNIDHIASIYRMYKGTSLCEKICEDGLVRNGDFYGYRYHFLDKRIEKLHFYLHNNALARDNATVEACKNIIFYTTKHLTIITYYKKKFNYQNHPKAHLLVAEYEKENRKIRAELNENIASLIRELIDLAEKEWDSDKADILSEKYLGIEYLQEVSKKFASKKNRLCKNLMKINLDYEKYFLDYI